MMFVQETAEEASQVSYTNIESAVIIFILIAASVAIMGVGYLLSKIYFDRKDK